MKRLDGKKVFGIRKLKVGVCSILLAVSFVGAQNVLAEEVAPLYSVNYRRKQATNN